MFQRFTPEARRALASCMRTAGNARAGTDHLLLGVLEEWSDVPEDVRADLGVRLAELRARTRSLMDMGSHVARGREPSYAPDARRALMHAQEEAWRLDDPCIGTEHLLLGLIREADGTAGRVLREAGLRLDDLRRRIVIVKQRPLPGEDPGATAFSA